MLNFNTRTTTTSCLTLRLADNITLMTDLELHHLIRSIYCKYLKLSQKCLDVAEFRINFTRLSTLKDPTNLKAGLEMLGTLKLWLEL